MLPLTSKKHRSYVPLTSVTLTSVTPVLCYCALPETLLTILLQDTISILHNATTAGIVPVVQELMSSERLALSRDQYGATPLHKAVLFYQPKLVKLISEKFPLTTKVCTTNQIRIIQGNHYYQAKDQEGRTPLHYAAALHDSGIFYRYLLKCGADELIQDKVGVTNNGNLPS